MSRVVSRWFITEAPIAAWRRNGFTWAIGAKAPRLLLVTGFPLQFFCEHGQGFIRIAARAASGIKRERSRSSLLPKLHGLVGMCQPLPGETPFVIVKGRW